MKIILIIISIILLSIFDSYSQNYVHFISWGDEEGITKRPEKNKSIDINLKNKALPLLKNKLEEIEKTESY